MAFDSSLLRSPMPSPSPPGISSELLNGLYLLIKLRDLDCYDAGSSILLLPGPGKALLK